MAFLNNNTQEAHCTSGLNVYVCLSEVFRNLLAEDREITSRLSQRISWLTERKKNNFRSQHLQYFRYDDVFIFINCNIFIFNRRIDALIVLHLA